jgi:hypothetical protein
MTGFLDIDGGRPSWVGWAVSVSFHSQILRSLAAATACPSGLNATELIADMGPIRGRPSRVGWVPSVVRTLVPAVKLAPPQDTATLSSMLVTSGATLSPMMAGTPSSAVGGRKRGQP